MGYILGINCFTHDSAATLLKDGIPIFACEEERLNREKHTKKFPKKAIEYALRTNNLSFKNLDHVAFFFDYKLATVNFIKYIIRYFPRSLIFITGDRPSIGLDLLTINQLIKKEFTIPPSDNHYRFHYVKHHECHAASSFFVSPFDEAAILSIDGWGELTSTWLGRGYENRIEAISVTNYPNSIGSFYATFTDYLGFQMLSDEYKVMGLAAYGKSTFKDKFKELIRFKENGEIQLNLKYFTFWKKNWTETKWYSDELIKLLGPSRKEDEPITERHMDIAATLQYVTEEAIIHVARHLYKLTKSKNLAYAGGVALNCVANRKILEATPFKNIFIQPAANDAGTSLGAALYCYHLILNNPRRYVMENCYLGGKFSDADFIQAIKEFNLSSVKSNCITKDVAKLLADGKIVAWFQDRMEFGPRALGNRSILADPRRADMKDIINAKVKFREPFRPFAPSVLEEKSDEYFNEFSYSPFMLLVAPVKESKKEVIPAVTHVDGTARVQTVSRLQNPIYYELIKEFEKLTGVPVLLNTSFNIKGEPIVFTPIDAIKCFLKTDIDYLVLGSYILQKKLC